MTRPAKLNISAVDLDQIVSHPGRVVLFAGLDGSLDQAGRRVNRLTRGAVERFLQSEAFQSLKAGQFCEMAFPSGMAASALMVFKFDKRAPALDARAAGVAIGKAATGKATLILAQGLRHPAEIGFGAVLRTYAFVDHKTKADDGESREAGDFGLMVSKPDDVDAAAAPLMALAEGVFFTRDLVNEPSNILTTTEFADRLSGLSELGVKVEVLDEPELEKIGMRTLLAVGQGSESPSKVVVMQWNGGGDEPPLALIGKGVVFDTGGISLKPAGGMEDMTMDMGGAGTVAGVMKSLALRGAKANVVALVGLVENMPDGRAQRPGDVVRSLKGDTVEVINTDAEGRLVLCDVMWYAQDRFAPVGMIDLATLTGAIIISLGHERAGVFSNDETFAGAFLKAADLEGEGAWRMPLGAAYDKMLKSNVADMKNVGGREAGAITAAQYLQRFVRDGLPWIHLDIAGVASIKSDGPISPKGATGWGVLAINRLISDGYES